MKKALVLILMLLFYAIPCHAADQLKDYLIRGIQDYQLSDQSRNFNQVTVNSLDITGKKTVKTAHEGNCVYSEYRYGGDKAAKPGNLQIKRYYQAALKKLEGKVLWEEDSGFHGSFIRNGRQYYMTVWSSNGDRYQVYILEESGLKYDANILNDDTIIDGIPNYELTDQKKNYDQLTINSIDPQSKKNVKTNYEGKRVFSEYKYRGEKVSRPGNVEIIRYYQAALRKLGGEVLWEDNASFHASFKRNGKQHYMTVWSSNGDRYQVYILEMANLDTDVEILDDDITDDNIIDDKKKIDDVDILDDDNNTIIDDVKTVEPVKTDKDEKKTTAPTKDVLSDLAKLFKKTPDTPVTPDTKDTKDTEYYTLGNDKITSMTKLVGQRKVVKTDSGTKGDIMGLVIEYSTDPNDHTQAANDVAKYFQYLLANEEFVSLKAFSGMPYEGGIEMSFAKNSVDNGKIIILDIQYNSKGYTLEFRKGAGSLTRNP